MNIEDSESNITNNEHSRSKYSIKKINNIHEYSLIRAIIIAIAYHNKGSLWLKMRQRDSNKHLVHKVYSTVKAINMIKR